MNYRTDPILGEAFYMFILWSFISQILDFLYWLAFRLTPRSLPEHQLPYVQTLLAYGKRWFDDAKPIRQQFLLQRFFQWQRPQVSFFYEVTWKWLRRVHSLQFSTHKPA